ncbi:MAG: magnesium-dependent phosphatase-1 [Cyclobacteriaceae bacterium]|nr:magnesium-dependent phosphatase-1 [Cyclobacteriaceae bacterium]
MNGLLKSKFELIIFDLDFTLWDCGGTWCDHTTPPFHMTDGSLYDAAGRKIELYPDVRLILKKLKDNNKLTGIASRTYEPAWANIFLEKLEIRHFFDYAEIYPGDKTLHFNKLKKKSGIPFEKMIFFDDEIRNIRDVTALGVTSIYVQNGIHRELVEENFY